jgi:hypothetical protein
MNTKTTIAICLAVAVLAVALAPTLVTTANAARETTQTCTNKGGQEKTCDSPPANCETTTVKAGQGKGSGEIKSSDTACSTP